MHGEKMDRWIQQAKDLGLVVQVVDDSQGILESISAVICRPQVPERNMLDVVRNAEAIYLHSVRCFGEGRWSNSARHRGYTDSGSYDIAVSRAHYHISTLADN